MSQVFSVKTTAPRMRGKTNTEASEAVSRSEPARRSEASLARVLKGRNRDRLSQVFDRPFKTLARPEAGPNQHCI